MLQNQQQSLPAAPYPGTFGGPRRPVGWIVGTSVAAAVAVILAGAFAVTMLALSTQRHTSATLQQDVAATKHQLGSVRRDLGNTKASLSTANLTIQACKGAVADYETDLRKTAAPMGAVLDATRRYSLLLSGYVRSVMRRAANATGGTWVDPKTLKSERASCEAGGAI